MIIQPKISISSKSVIITFLIVFNAASFAVCQNLQGKVCNWSNLTSKKEGLTDTRRILKGTTVDLAAFEIVAKTLPPGDVEVMTDQTSDKAPERLIIVKEGVVQIKLDHESSTLGKGGVAIAEPGDMLTIDNNGNVPATYYILSYTSRSSRDDERGRVAGGSFVVDWKDVEAKPTDKGFRREFFDRATTMFARFEMHVTTLNNKDEVSHAPHTHRAEEIVLLIEGNVEMQIDTKHLKADPGAVIFLASNVPHALKNIGDKPCTYFAFQWQQTK